jgi:predicted cytidylate kinase
VQKKTIISYYNWFTMSYRVITVSGEVASGKSTVAEALIELLPGWKRINTGQRFRDFCASKGLSIQQVAQLPDEVHLEFDRSQTDLLQTETNAVIEGRLSGWLARGLEDVYKVFCYANLETRINRYMNRDNTSWNQAKQDIDDRDSKDVEKFKAIYAITDYRDPGFYDLILDTSSLSPVALAMTILQNAGLKIP